MQKATVITKPYVLCPTCKEGEFAVGHLIGREEDGDTWTWLCDSCGAGILFKLESGIFYCEPNPLQWKKKCVVLLRLRQHRSVYAVVQDNIYHFAPDGGNKQSFYDEHTCPTNFLRNIEYLVEGNDTDPHGIFEFMAMQQINGDLEDNMTVAELAALFNFPSMVVENPLQLR